MIIVFIILGLVLFPEMWKNLTDTFYDESHDI
jgi:hypothetical protein